MEINTRSGISIPVNFKGILSLLICLVWFEVIRLQWVHMVFIQIHEFSKGYL